MSSLCHHHNVVVNQSTAQAFLTPHNNVFIITSWKLLDPLLCGLSQIIICSVLIFSWASCSDTGCVCVCSCAEALTPLLATIPPVTELSSGTASSFHQGSFYDQWTCYYRNSITSCDWADCWSPQQIKALYKKVWTQTPFYKNPVWHGSSPWVLLEDAVPEGELCHAVVKLNSLLA